MSGGRVHAGVDIGTYGSTGVLARADGAVLLTVSRSHDLDTPRPGWAEQDADAVWWADLCAITRELDEGAQREGLALDGLAVSAIGPTCLPVDPHGAPLRPAILYGIDTRAQREIAELDGELGVERILEVCGAPLTSQAVGPKVRWLQRHEPEIWARTAKILTAHSYLVARLTSRYVVDAYSAAAQTPFSDLVGGGWSEELTTPICPLEVLPEIAGSSAEVVGTLTADAARATGLPAGLPVAAGTIDAAAEAVAAGVSDPGDMTVTYGTTAFFIQVSAKPVVSENLWGGVWVDGARSVTTGGMATTGAITEWIRGQLTDIGDTDGAFETLFAEAEGSAPGANGLLLLPYFSGERTPINAPWARGVVAGLSLATTRGDLMQAVFEAMGFGVRHHLEVMSAVGATPSRLVAIGGGARSRVWRQAVSDATGMAQDVPAEQAGAAHGDAMLAAVATGALNGVRDIAERIRIAERVEPDSGLRGFYDERYRSYRDLFEQSGETIRTLTSAGGSP